MKKTLSLILAVLMVVAAFAMFAINTSADDGWTYEDGVLTITGPMEEVYTDDDRPWNEYKDEVTKIVIADGVTMVGKNAFSHFGALEEVEFGKDAVDIRMDAIAYDEALTKIVFKGKLEAIGQGVAFGSGTGEGETVVLTDLTFKQFKALATVANYNFEKKGGIATIFDRAEYVIEGNPDPDPEYEAITVEPNYGKIENWGNPMKTYMIVGGNFSDFMAEGQVKGTEANPATLKLKVLLTDTVSKKTYVIDEYAFDNPGKEIYQTSFFRLAVCEYGIVLDPTVPYTVALEFINAEGKAVAKGASEEGAFVSTNANFLENGSIIPEEIPHTSHLLDEEPVTEPTPTPVDDKIAVYLDIYGATGTESWAGSPNAANDNVPGETQILLCPFTDESEDAGVPEIVVDGLEWKVTIKGPDGKSKTYNWKVDSHYDTWLARFEPLNGNRTAEDKFVPTPDTEYEVTFEAVGTDGKTYYSGNSVKISFTEESIIDVNPDVVPVETGDNTAVIVVLAIVALFGTAVVVSKKVLSK